MSEIGTHRVETSESGRVTIVTGEALQAEHAANLRMVLYSQVDNLRKRLWSMYHEARDLKSILSQERTPMGFNKYDLKGMFETLECVESLGTPKTTNTVSNDEKSLSQLIQDDLTCLCDSGWFSNTEDQDKFTTLACQIVVDRVKEGVKK